MWACVNALSHHHRLSAERTNFLYVSRLDLNKFHERHVCIPGKNRRHLSFVHPAKSHFLHFFQIFAQTPWSTRESSARIPFPPQASVLLMVPCFLDWSSLSRLEYCPIDRIHRLVLSNQNFCGARKNQMLVEVDTWIRWRICPFVTPSAIVHCV